MLRARPASQFGLHLLTTTHVLVRSMLWVYSIALYDMLSSEYCRSRELCGQAPDGFPLKKKKNCMEWMEPGAARMSNSVPPHPVFSPLLFYVLCVCDFVFYCDDVVRAIVCSCVCVLL